MIFNNTHMDTFCNVMDRIGLPVDRDFFDHELNYKGPSSLIPHTEVDRACAALNAALVPHLIIPKYTSSRSMLLVRTSGMDGVLKARAAKEEQMQEAHNGQPPRNSFSTSAAQPSKKRYADA